MKTSFRNISVDEKRREVLLEKVRTYTDTLLARTGSTEYAHPESSLTIAGDVAYQNDIQKKLRPFKKVKHVVLVGIGGQSLGTEAVFHALSHTKSPSLTVIDSIEKDSYVRLQNRIDTIEDLKDVVVVISSKSGSTTETISNAVTTLHICEKKFGKTFLSQVIFIGDSESALFTMGRERGILCFPMPAPIGGRYSIFSAAGIVPLTLLGIDTASLRKGALDAVSKKEMRRREVAAVTLALLAESGVHTINFFAFNKRLLLCGFWYRQLLAESIGKNQTKQGTPFMYPILPIVSSSVDLHSMAQLYLGGYKNMYTHFVYYNEHQSQRVRSNHWLLTHSGHIRGKTFDEINDAIMHGVQAAYNDQKLPYQYTELTHGNAYEIGFLMSSLMCEVMCLSYVLDVNAFDQPSVELYKKHTRKVLEK